MGIHNRVTTAIAVRVANAESLALSPQVSDRAKQHLLDSMISMLSGATLRPGRIAASYAASRGGIGDSTVIGGGRTNPEQAAFANAVSAHADETDDVNNRARVHPGATIVPAAIAVAEAYDRPGTALLNAVSLGYDLACSVNVAAWRSFRSMQQSPRTSHGLGPTFGAAAVAASLAGMSVPQIRQVMSYAAQQVSGISTLYRDPDHVGKAFATSAMQAFSGVRAAELVRAGFTGIDDVFDGSPNVFDAFGDDGDPSRILDDLERTRHVTTTDIKRHPVGGPIQAAVEALGRLIDINGITVGDVAAIDVHLPTQGAYIVDNREMPDINLQYILTVLLLDGQISFASAHDYNRCRSAAAREVMRRIRAVPDSTLDAAPGADPASRRVWRASVVVRTMDGRSLIERVDTPRGTFENPISWEELQAKASATLDGVLSDRLIEDLVSWVRGVEMASSVRELRRFMDEV